MPRRVEAEVLPRRARAFRSVACEREAGGRSVRAFGWLGSLSRVQLGLIVMNNNGIRQRRDREAKGIAEGRGGR